MIELCPGRGFEFAVEDLAGWGYLWLVFWFHLNSGWRAKVLPPRSDRRRGVFATRSPHRPNPIGLSAVELVSIEGLTLRVRGVDLIDGTPILDIKPYLPYADAFPHARTGWLGEASEDGEHGAPRTLDSSSPDGAEAAPTAGYRVRFEEQARAQLDWLRARNVDLETPILSVLETSPNPHPYRRIRRSGCGFRIAVHEWRAAFTVSGREVLVAEIASGYKKRELLEDRRPGLDLHRAFASAFGEKAGSVAPPRVL